MTETPACYRIERRHSYLPDSWQVAGEFVAGSPWRDGRPVDDETMREEVKLYESVWSKYTARARRPDGTILTNKLNQSSDVPESREQRIVRQHSNPDMTKDDKQAVIMFCRALQRHLDGGPKPKWFDKFFGLCRNFYNCYPQRLQDGNGLEHIIGWKSSTPFNTGSPLGFRKNAMADYTREKAHGLAYKNTRRLAFIRKWAAKELEPKTKK